MGSNLVLTFDAFTNISLFEVESFIQEIWVFTLTVKAYY